MASIGFIESLLNVFPQDQRRALGESFREAIKLFRIGSPEAGKSSENLAGGFLEVTTSTTAGQEVAVAHGLGVTPYLVMPVVPVQSSGVSMVPFTVTRSADASNIYVSSSLTARTFRLYVEV